MSLDSHILGHSLVLFRDMSVHVPKFVCMYASNDWTSVSELFFMKHFMKHILWDVKAGAEGQNWFILKSCMSTVLNAIYIFSTKLCTHV